MDKPSDIPGHVWPPVAVFQQREGVVVPGVTSAQGCRYGVDEGSALSSGDILYPWWTARQSGRGSIGGGVRVWVLLYGTDNEFFVDDGFWFLFGFLWVLDGKILYS